jgi:hypothetical protein
MLASSFPGPALPFTLAALTPALEGFFFIFAIHITSGIGCPEHKKYIVEKCVQKKLKIPRLLIAQIFEIFYIK